MYWLMPAAKEHATQTIGFAYRAAAPPGFIFDWLSDAIATTHLSLYMGTGGYVAAYRGDGTLLGTSASGLVTNNTFQYVEFKAVLGDSTAGSFIVKLDGVVALTVSGVDTKNGGTKTVFDSFSFGRNNYGGFSFDDVYCVNGDATAPNDFLGDVIVEAIDPTGAGTTANFTPSAGANWQNVDEHVEDADTTYNSSATVGNKDTFAYADLAAASGAVKFVQATFSARKEGSVTTGLKQTCRSSGTEVDKAEHTFAATYGSRPSDTWALDPNGGIAWTRSAVNAAEWGYKLTTLS